MTATSGILAALGGPFVMTLGFIIWDNVWKGSAFALNMFKCCVASLGFVVVSVVTRAAILDSNDEDADNDGRLFPPSVFTTQKVGYLMLSSTVGIVIGDLTWLEGLRLIGARRVILVDTLKPFLAALFGWTILGETLPYQAFGGMALTVAGVTWVSLEKENDKDKDSPHENEDEQDRPNKDNAVLDLTTTSNTYPHTLHDDTIVDESARNGIRGDDAVEENAVKEIVEEHHEEDEGLVIEVTSLNATPIPATPTRDSNNDNETLDEIVVQKEEEEEFPTEQQQQQQNYRRGYALAVLNVVLDTYGSLLTKEYGGGMTTWEISLIRFGFAGIVMACISVGMYIRNHTTMFRTEETKDSNTNNNNNNSHVEQTSYDNPQNDNDNDTHSSSRTATITITTTTSPWYLLPTQNGSGMTRQSWIQIVVGVVCVTFVTPALSNYALFQIALALALTLGSIGPLYALPLTWILQKDIPTWRSCLGAVCAVAGIVILSLYK